MSDASDNVKVVITLPEELVKSLKNVAHHGDKKQQQSKDISSKIEFEISRESEVNSIRSYLEFLDKTKYLPEYSLIDVSTGKTVSDDCKIGEIVAGGDAKKTPSESINLSLRLSPFDKKKAIVHVLGLRNNLGFSNELEDDISEIAMSSGSTFHKLKFTEPKANGGKTDSKEESEEAKKTFELSSEEKIKFNEIVANTLKQTLPITQLIAETDIIVTPALRSLNFSQFNPVPSVYRARGHTVYVQVVTWEAETLHITGTSSGFFLNRCNSNKFDPNPKDDSLLFVTLFDLINFYSKKFSQHLQDLNKKLSSVPMISYVKPLTGCLDKSWLIKPSVLNNYGDYLRLQMSSLSPFENKINFNADFQSIKDLDTEELSNRITAEKSLIRIVDIFTKNAIKGVMKIFNGEMDPYVTSSEETDNLLSQTFFEDDIFYSFVHDFDGANKAKGGDEYSYSLVNSDLKATIRLHKVNPMLMRYRLMCVVDFCGKRILCESPVAGLLTNVGVKFNKDPETGSAIITEEMMEEYTNVIYGTNAVAEQTGDGPAIVYDAEFNDSLDEIAKGLHLKPHTIDGNEFKVSSSSSGLIGTDKRKYLVNLNNLTPTDTIFTAKHFDQVEDSSKKYVHRHIKLRHELVDNWWSTKTQDLDIEKCYNEYKFSFNTDDEKDQVSQEISTFLVDNVIPTFLRDILDENIQVPLDGENLVDNLHKNGINIRYLYKLIELIEEEFKFEINKKIENTKKVEAVNVEHREYESKITEKIEKMIQERQKIINELVIAGKEVPEDMKMENMKIDENDIRKPINDQPFMVSYDKLNPLKKIAQLEIVSRSLKHILRKYSRDLPISVVPTLVSHVYNLLFGSEFNTKPVAEFLDTFYTTQEFEFVKISKKDLVEEIISQAAIRFRYNLSSEDLDFLLSVKPFVLIRSLNKKFGIQMTNRPYYFTTEQYDEFLGKQDKKTLKTLTQQVASFSPKDFSVIPVTKDCTYASGLISQIWNSGAIALASESSENNQNIEESLGLLNQAVAWREKFYGIVHKSVAEDYLKLSSINSKLNDFENAIALARKAVIIFERTCGSDSFLIVRSLLNLIFLEIANNSPYNAIQLCERVLQITETIMYNEHPVLIHVLNNMQKLALGCKESKRAIDLLERENTLIEKYNGGKNCAYAMNLSTMANIYASKKELNNSLRVVKEAYDIFAAEVGLNHHLTATSDQWVQSLSNIIQSEKSQKQVTNAQNSVSSGSSTATTATTNKQSSKKKKGKK